VIKYILLYCYLWVIIIIERTMITFESKKNLWYGRVSLQKLLQLLWFDSDLHFAILPQSLEEKKKKRK